MKDTHLTTNVLKSETMCNCGCGLGYNTLGLPVVTYNITKLAHNIQTLIDFLQIVLPFPGPKIKLYAYISSWCRCPIHNKNEGGADDSKHLNGSACDLKLYNKMARKFPKVYINPIKIVRAAILLNEDGQTNFGGIGLYDSFVHLDIRHEHYYWRVEDGVEKREVNKFL